MRWRTRRRGDEGGFAGLGRPACGSRVAKWLRQLGQVRLGGVGLASGERGAKREVSQRLCAADQRGTVRRRRHGHRPAERAGSVHGADDAYELLRKVRAAFRRDGQWALEARADVNGNVSTNRGFQAVRSHLPSAAIFVGDMFTPADFNWFWANGTLRAVVVDVIREHAHLPPGRSGLRRLRAPDTHQVADKNNPMTEETNGRVFLDTHIYHVFTSSLRRRSPTGNETGELKTHRMRNPQIARPFWASGARVHRRAGLDRPVLLAGPKADPAGSHRGRVDGCLRSKAVRRPGECSAAAHDGSAQGMPTRSHRNPPAHSPESDASSWCPQNFLDSFVKAQMTVFEQPEEVNPQSGQVLTQDVSGMSVRWTFSKAGTLDSFFHLSP
eukprot:scaffold434_cov186-Pinguiococcus_pyrenoidosus.AAC.47